MLYLYQGNKFMTGEKNQAFEMKRETILIFVGKVYKFQI
jgi:hypothetical protein